jgi:hypothetical protein
VASDRRRPPSNVFSAEVKYDLTKAELEALIREHSGLADGIVEWDISNTGKVRGASIRVSRTEIKG